MQSAGRLSVAGRRKADSPTRAISQERTSISVRHASAPRLTQVPALQTCTSMRAVEMAPRFLTLTISFYSSNKEPVVVLPIIKNEKMYSSIMIFKPIWSAIALGAKNQYLLDSQL